MFVFCSILFTYWERADLLALLCVMFFCVLVTFSYGVLGQVWYLIVSIIDLCLFLTFLRNIVLITEINKSTFYAQCNAFYAWFAA